MTDTPESGPMTRTVQPIVELFNGGAQALWATTYTMDLALFNEFLLARLGEPPLNIAVLADHRRLSTSLGRIPAQRADTLAPVNRRWLLRGVRISGAFHPKSYLAVADGRATLLVGSGNLSAGGLDDGREAFTTFRSGTLVGDAAIAAWRSWMRRLVGIVGDTTLAARFQHLEGQIPSTAVVTQHVPSPLLHNLDTPIADQLATVVTESGTRVNELWLAAPFYDADAVAVGTLLDMLKPERVKLFVTGSTSVNGERLAERLATSGAGVDVAAYEPDQFVHAKLIGILAGPRAWLLSGSANLSSAALRLTHAAQGNIELAVLAPLGTDEVRAAFTPPGTTVREHRLQTLTYLSFRARPEPALPAVQLVAASAHPDGRIEITTEPAWSDDWLLDDLTCHQALTADDKGRVLTVGPLEGRLVQLLDADKQVLSNRVIVDDPAALAATLIKGSTRSGGDIPPELHGAELDTPLGRALVRLHRNLAMDVSELATTTSTAAEARGEHSEQTDDDLWERLEREQFACDPRASIYNRVWRRHTLGGAEPLIELIDALRASTPATAGAHPHSLLAQLLDRTHEQPAQGEHRPPRPWKPSTRIRTRARNLLRRWAAAQTDPRLVWVDPFAPAVNFSVMALTLACLRLDQARHPERGELTEDDLDEIWQLWLRPFVGTGQGDGWLDQLDEPTRTQVLDRLPTCLPETVAALCWLLVQPGRDRRERIVASKPVLSAALAHGLLDPTEATSRYLTDVTRQTVTCDMAVDQLLGAVDFIDDDLWCARTAEEFGLDELRLAASPDQTVAIRLRLDVRGITTPFVDARVPRLVVAAQHYRRCDGVVLRAVEGGWRLSFVTDETIAYLPGVGGALAESTQPLTRRALEELCTAGGVLADLFPSEYATTP
ncbi:hypothetical protein [Streptomyces alboniger]|uniref:PLD phosphodiesterase domain-containing protein n=1 Tax=Streptomyces alboniger TaxID=132473 RepID=A0A5J6HGM1_STRAD|nr:hypothetical protein [Streptomyces alboniger]QEV16205.1 hypothetical protein CP975_00605 [Streptomyces alboniger]